MSSQSEGVLALKSAKAQLEVMLIYLRRRQAELKRQLGALESQPRSAGANVEARLELKRMIDDHATQIERRTREIEQIDLQIDEALHQPPSTGAEHLEAEHDAINAELAEVRNEILTALSQLAAPLRRFEELAERKTQLSGDISARTGRNQAYQNYIESALFRQAEFTGDVRYVVELLRRQRVVA